MCGSYASIVNPSFLLAHPNGRWLYAVSETGKESHGTPGEVWALKFERDPFSIEVINHRSSGGDWPCHLQFDGAHTCLVTTNYGSGSAAIYPLQSDGSLAGMTDLVQHQGRGSNTARQEGPHAHSSIFTPQDRFVIVADLGIDQLVIYEFDQVLFKMKPHSSVSTRPGAGPRHFALHSNEKSLYVANELDSTVTLYDLDPANGVLLERQTLSTIPGGSPENIVADIHLSASGERLYVSNRGHNSIAVFDVQSDGSLTLVSTRDCGGNWPRNFALAPGEQFMLVANQYSNKVCVLPILQGAAALGSPIAQTPATGVSCIRFVPAHE